MRTELVQELREKGLNPDFHPSLGAFDEMYSIFELLTSKMSMEDLRSKIPEMFTDKTSKGVTLMTCHKSKGLEAENVFFLNSGLIPSKYAQSPQMLYAERCLYYVAVTRAKKNLVFIEI